MKANCVTVESNRETNRYEIKVYCGALASSGAWARLCLGFSARRIVIVSNPTVFDLYGQTVSDLLAEVGFTVSCVLLGDGEQYKDMRGVESALHAFGEAGLTRTDAVVAVGGGVVGDIAGFAAAIYLRGIAFLQIPTTLLGMVDSSVGGKTGVNSAFGKNLIGAFHQPAGVLVDPEVLRTLPQRELTAGFCEMIKHGAIKRGLLLTMTSEMLSEFPPDRFSVNMEASDFRLGISNLIAGNIVFKAAVVAEDPCESSDRTDPYSRKILNFGHTLAHALEKVTDYKYLKHGEAVGYGILFAAELSKSLALCAEKDVKLLNDVVHRAGPLPPLANLDAEEVFEAFRSDKKNLSGSLQMVLLKGIGKPVILSEKDIPRSTVRQVLKQFLKKSA